MLPVFPFADDFNGSGGLDSNKWNSSAFSNYVQVANSLYAPATTPSTNILNTKGRFSNITMYLRMNTNNITQSYTTAFKDYAVYDGTDQIRIDSGSTGSFSIGGSATSCCATPTSTYFLEKMDIPNAGSGAYSIFYDANYSLAKTVTGIPSNRNVTIGILPFVSGTDIMDWIFIKNYYTYDPFYSVGNQETRDITLNVATPVNNQTYYGNQNVNLMFQPRSQTTSTFSVNITYDGSLIYQNATFINNTNYTISQATTAGYHVFSVSVGNPTDYVNQNQTFYVFYGLNLTVYNANGTLLNGWNINVSNSTGNWSYFQNRNTSYLAEWNTLPQGNVNITFNDSILYDNVTLVYSINNSMLFNFSNVTLFNNQFFYARDSQSGSYISGFNITWLNSTGSSYSKLADGIQLTASVRYIPLGNNTLTVIANGYNTTTDSLLFNYSSAINKTYSLSNAGLSVYVYDERNNSLLLRFNIVASNQTAGGSCTITNSSILFFNYGYNSLCLGLNRISITNTSFIDPQTTVSGYSYPNRDYFITLSQTSTINFTGYLLRSDQGVFHQFVVTDFNTAPIPNITITVSKLIGGVYVPVAQGLTDTGGGATIWMDANTVYQVVVTGTGYASQSFTLQPSNVNTISYIRLSSTPTNVVNITSIFDGVTVIQSPRNSNQNSSFTIAFTIISSRGDLSFYGTRIVLRNITNASNFTDIFTQNGSNPIGSTISFTTPNVNGFYDVYVYYNRTNFTSLFYLPKLTYYQNNVSSGLPQINLTPSGFSQGTMQILGIIILAVVTAFFSTFGVFAGVFGGLAVMGWMTFGMGIFHWATFALTFLAVMAFVMLRRAF